ncbi:TAXI family TRAP transporter solute-binding subunit [Martelella soudanensis]|uniref:TAXI family TRAP transporter solute-binding subunit n=1 Tax=unclassified Martelella TaxID=2629616 RepID=UPI001FEDBCE1|nr:MULTISPECIES: TAXI family TRAP transporter solute-binding subunit [unclassified Martelella]
MFHSNLMKGTVVAVAMLTASAAFAQDDVTLPRSMIWTSYDLGSTGYVEASAMADALDKKFDIAVRLTPSGTAIGRLLPLVRGRANFGFMGNEILFASDATYEFAAADWGPQDLRVLMGRPAAVGLVAGNDTDVETMDDLKGANVGFVEASPSTTMNTEAALAFAGLTPDDVNKVMYPGYGAMMSAFVAGEVDVVPVTTTVAALREAEGGRGFHWLDMSADNAEGWDRVTKRASLFQPITMTTGAGISEENPAELLGYSYPQLTTLASTDEDEVYNLLKALDQVFPDYQNTNAVMPNWNLEKSGRTPAGAPFHPGAVKYLRERGLWTDADQAWNDQRIAEIEETKEMWAAATAAAKDQGVAPADWVAFWEQYRTRNAQ